MVTPNEEGLHRTLNHYSVISFRESYWSLSTKEREEFHRGWLHGLCEAAQNVDIFQATETGIDLIVWCALPADEKDSAARFFERLAAANNPYRQWIDLKDSLWGFTRPRNIRRRARSRRSIPLLKRANRTWSFILSARPPNGIS